VSTPAGTYRLGPENGTLSVRTRRTGAVAKAGHDLLIHVTAWEAEVGIADDPAATTIELSADGGSLRVREGTGGMKALDDDDRANIEQTIDDEILMRQPVTFRTTRVEPARDGGDLYVEGDVTIRGTTRPITFDLTVAEDGALRAVTTIRQTDFGMKPYTALFGALKVADEVEIEIDASLPTG
jgi:polyisoprenoid-binding protein YceI